MADSSVAVICAVVLIGALAFGFGMALLVNGGKMTVPVPDGFIETVFPASVPLLHPQNMSMTIGDDTAIIWAKPQIVLYGTLHTANAVYTHDVQATGIGSIITTDGIYQNIHWILTNHRIIFAWEEE